MNSPGLACNKCLLFYACKNLRVPKGMYLLYVNTVHTTMKAVARGGDDGCHACNNKIVTKFLLLLPRWLSPTRKFVIDTCVRIAWLLSART